jgi:uncharacterized protein (DUF1778 family)
MKDKRISLKINAELNKKIRDFAKIDGRSVNNFITLVLYRFFRENRKKPIRR